MKVVRRLSEIGEVVARARAAAGAVGFVPTMGALHEGHLSLIARARSETAVVALSIFVNPLQFGDGEDLDSYPRDEERDLDLAAEGGVDIAFVPAAEEMYPPERATAVHVEGPALPLEGAARPGHFDGVATVVAKLFNLVRPEVAYFGQKDAQQLAVVRRMVDDLSFPLKIVACPTVRASDGLALSSRNAYLSGDERERASALWRALQEGARVVRDADDAEAAEKRMWEVLAGQGGVDPEYAAAVDPDTFRDPVPGRPLLLAVAARVGRARLIDNVLLERPGPSRED